MFYLHVCLDVRVQGIFWGVLFTLYCGLISVFGMSTCCRLIFWGENTLSCGSAKGVSKIPASVRNLVLEAESPAYADSIQALNNH